MWGGGGGRRRVEEVESGAGAEKLAVERKRGRDEKGWGVGGVCRSKVQ